ncbi:MAG TPA: DUF4388 domain-containing protein [Thermoanaerobaculia bacterium]|jgi:hypothetical protein|nr:DUF4388 domain-containing protein [Thermoanaerobaculia bacterium]
MAFQGSLKELPLPDIIQLVSVSGKTGVFSLTRNGDSAGEIYLRSGQIVHAHVGDLQGEEAVYELAIWPEGEFVFTPGRETELTTIQKSNTNLLMEAARRIDEWQVLSKRIPSTRLVPVFTNQAATTSVSLTPQEWALICKIDERRTIEEVAIGLDMSPFETCKLLYGLITSGLVSLDEDLSRIRPERLHKLTGQELARLAEDVDRQARALLSGHPRQAELDVPFRMSKAEMDAGRGVEAVLDLVRSEEKVVSAALGPNQSKLFLDRISQLLER